MDLLDIAIAKKLSSGGGGGGGSSDFSTATVTVTSNGEHDLNSAVPIIMTMGGEEGMVCIPQIGQAESVPIKFVLFKEYLYFSFNELHLPDVAVTGNIEYNDGAFIITGDGTITITKK